MSCGGNSSSSSVSITDNSQSTFAGIYAYADALLTPELKSVIIGGSVGGNVVSSTVAACLDLSSSLVPTYITAIPFDPKVGSVNKTYYAVKKTAGGRMNLQACGAENGEGINVVK